MEDEDQGRGVGGARSQGGEEEELRSEETLRSRKLIREQLTVWFLAGSAVEDRTGVSFHVFSFMKVSVQN